MSIHKTYSHTHTHTAYSSLDIPIFTKIYEFYKNLYSALKLFPKRDRCSLGQKIDNITLELFELLFQTTTIERSQKLETLQITSNKLNLLKVLLRLAHDNKSLNTKMYLSLQENLQEIGKMTGGWIKYLKNS